MSASTTYPTTWHSAGADLMVVPLPADVSVSDAFYAEQYVMVVQPDDLGLLWPVRLTVERDEDVFIVSDDFTDVYGEGKNQEEAVVAYRAALAALHRVLSAREDTLDAPLLHQLALLRSIVPPGE